MHNQLSKAIVHGDTGPFPASKITLECKKAKITYFLGTAEKGQLAEKFTVWESFSSTFR